MGKIDISPTLIHLSIGFEEDRLLINDSKKDFSAFAKIKPNKLT